MDRPTMTSGDRDWRTDDTDALFEAIVAIDTIDQAAGFFRDLCTRRELEELSHRWLIARMLDEGLSYREIASRTGASTATITRINQWLLHGTGGYRAALDRMTP